jgi:hypothetical protein
LHGAVQAIDIDTTVQLKAQVNVRARKADSSHRLVGGEEVQVERIGSLISGQGVYPMSCFNRP